MIKLGIWPYFNFATPKSQQLVLEVAVVGDYEFVVGLSQRLRICGEAIYLNRFLYIIWWPETSPRFYNCEGMLNSTTRCAKKLHDNRSRWKFQCEQNTAELELLEECLNICNLCASKEGPEPRSKGQLKPYISGSPWERIA